jgi:hypothetical protein
MSAEGIVASLRRRFRAEPNASDHEDLLHQYGNTPLALLHSILFVPQLIELEGYVFLRQRAATSPEQAALAAKIRQARAVSKAELQELVSSYNWVEVPYQFMDRDSTDIEDELLAESMAEAWRGRLAFCFPQKQFTVRVLRPAETGSVVGVGFQQAL